jgi:NifB/MoaA-like Fe-S oxidoreductase
LRRIANAGIEINTQIVLCPEINDGCKLEQSIRDLVSLGPALKSIALVPVGLTRYRPHDETKQVRPFTKHEAEAVIDSIQPFQQQMRRERGRSVIYLADEFYNLSDRPFPSADLYDDFPQLENGVGLVALFQKELAEAVNQSNRRKTEPVWHVDPVGSTRESKLLSKDKKPVNILVTGKAAEPVLKSVQAVLSRHSGCPVTIQSVTNRFFGETVTVAGLLTGRDIVDQVNGPIQSLRAEGFEPRLFFPTVLFKAGEPVTLDGMCLNEISQQLSAPVWVLRPSGKDLVGVLADMCQSVKRS